MAPFLGDSLFSVSGKYILNETNSSSQMSMPGVRTGGPSDNIQHAKALFVLAIIGPILAALLVVNRLVFRFRITGGMGLDDWTITIATGFLFAQSAASIAAVVYGYGQPLATVSFEKARTALFCFWLLQVFYKLTINTVKLSILALYGRVFYFNDKITWTCVYAFIIVFAAELAFMLGTVLQCWPVGAAWDLSIADRACTNTTAFWWSNALWNIGSDVFLILLPVPVIKKLKVTLAKKIGLACMFSIGLIVIITAILRFTTLRQAAMKKEFEPLSGTFVSTTWTAAEAALAIICANIPMLRQLFETCIPALRESLHGSTSNTEGTDIPGWVQAENRGSPSEDSGPGEEASTRCLNNQRGHIAVSKEPIRAHNVLGNIRRSMSWPKVSDEARDSR